MHSIAQASTATPSPKDQRAPGFTPDGQLTPEGQQVIAEMVEGLIAETGGPEDPQTLTKILEGLHKVIPAALARTIGQRAPEPGHYPWCKPDACTTRWDRGAGWTEHGGHEYFTVLEDHAGNSALRLVAQLAQDSGFHGPTPVVHLYDEHGDGVFLDGPALDEAIVHLEGLTGLLQVLRQQMAEPPAEDPARRERIERAVDQIMAAIAAPEVQA